MIENIIGNGEKSIAPIHGIAMPKDRLPDLTFYYRILQRFETQLRHGTFLTLKRSQSRLWPHNMRASVKR